MADPELGGQVQGRTPVRQPRGPVCQTHGHARQWALGRIISENPGTGFAVTRVNYAIIGERFCIFLYFTHYH